MIYALGSFVFALSPRVLQNPFGALALVPIVGTILAFISFAVAGIGIFGSPAVQAVFERPSGGFAQADDAAIQAAGASATSSPPSTHETALLRALAVIEFMELAEALGFRKEIHIPAASNSKSAEG